MQEAEGILEDNLPIGLMDKGLNLLRKIYEPKAPINHKDRRRFLKQAALSSAGIALMPQKAFSWGTNWKDYLLGQDPIFGPELRVNSGVTMNFNGHTMVPGKYGAVDYAVPISTPITPVANGHIFKHGFQNGKYIIIGHRTPQYISVYRFMNDITKSEGSVDLKSIIAYSGSGYHPAEGTAHLELQIFKLDPNKGNKSIPPGVDPFLCGIDGERPVYWDAKTEIYSYPINDSTKLEELTDTLESKLKGNYSGRHHLMPSA